MAKTSQRRLPPCCAPIRIGRRCRPTCRRAFEPAETLSRARSEGARSGNRNRPVPVAGRIDATTRARAGADRRGAEATALETRGPRRGCGDGGRRAGNRSSLVLQTAAPPPLSRFVSSLPEGVIFTGTGRHNVALSPDGARMAFVGGNRLYLRPLTDFEAKPIAAPTRCRM